MTDLKIVHLINGTYQVVDLLWDGHGYVISSVLYQGSLADCEAYIHAKQSSYFL